MIEFAEQLSIRIDKLVDNQRRIYRKGMLGGKIITFYVIGVDGGDPYGLTAIEGMTFRDFINSGIERMYLEIENDVILWDGVKLDASPDDVIVEYGFYECLRPFWLGDYACYGTGRFSEWVESGNNTHGFYFDDDGLLRFPDGKYVVEEDPYDTRYSKMVTLDDYIDDSEYYCYRACERMFYLEDTARPIFWSGAWSQVGYWDISDYNIDTRGGDKVLVWTWYSEPSDLLYNGQSVKVTDEIVLGGRYYIDW